jgi:4-hydroxy-3-polyprenylbenzoate decarboxylase
MDKLPVILAITGASGSIYALRTARAILLAGYPLEVIISPAARIVFGHELGLDDQQDFRQKLASVTGIELNESNYQEFDHSDIGAAAASGSHQTAGMVVVPCTMKTLAGVANGFSSNLIERSADVTLKEQRKLVLVLRESPLNLIHLRNQVAAAEAGATILPASPAFYQQPKTFDDLADFIAARALNILGIEQQLFPAWGEENATER